MDIEKLLFVTKFEELWFDALQSLLALKEAALHHVVFLNVIEREKVSMRRGTGYQKTEEIKLREKANIRFIDWAENLFEQGMEVGVYIVVGSFAQQVILAAEKEGVDLIVIGHQKKGKLEQLYSGSDVIEIISRAATPVLVYKDMSQEGKPSDQLFERPILATDWSPASQRATEYLKGMRDIVQKVSVVHVAAENALNSASAMAVQKTRKDGRRKLEEICDILEAEGIEARAHVYVGDPALEIERAAREHRASLMLMGTSGKSTWRERWIGSTPRALAEKSVFPTLLVPPEQT
ncbi:MAG: universal stress protein family protein [Desulfobacteraceae bacterium 4572_88]|nr:MAG: universal stress protein family protein [Desulfobacteraceae bacterium 4572_88]RLC11588.1 MAG: universal stress protein [Deltaproteobacteria bacterium]